MGHFPRHRLYFPPNTDGEANFPSSITTLAATEGLMTKEGARQTQAGSMGKRCNNVGILCTSGMSFIGSSEKKGDRLRVVTGLPGWHRAGSDGGVRDKEVEKQSGGIHNYRDVQRHSKIVIARTDTSDVPMIVFQSRWDARGLRLGFTSTRICAQCAGRGEDFQITTTEKRKSESASGGSALKFAARRICHAVAS